MHQVKFRAAFVILAVAIAIGCSKTSKPTSSDDGELAESSNKPATKQKVPVRRDAKDLIGNWAVVVTTQDSNRQVTDNFRWIVKFLKNDMGKTVVELVDNSQDNPQTKTSIADSQVDGDSVKITFSAGEALPAGAKFDFEGSFQEGIIRGTISVNPSTMFLTRLLSTDENSLENYSVVSIPFGTDVIQAKMKDTNTKPADLLETLRETSQSPLAQDIYKMMLQPPVQNQLDEATLQSLIKDYLSSAKIWGERWERDAERIIAEALITGRRFANLAAPHLDAAEKGLGDAEAAIKNELAGYREAADVILKVSELKSADASDEVRKAAFDKLSESLGQQQFNSEILEALATYSEKNGQTDAAIEYLSRIVSLPLLEAMIMRMRAGEPPDGNLPNEVLKKLWVQKHGNEDGLKDHLAAVYRREIAAYTAEMQKRTPPAPAADKSNRTVFVELFTGMQCPPCVAADLALSAISKTYAPTQVQVVRFHQHIPLPDGLTNQSSEERATFYDLSSTPAVTVDGILIDPRFYTGPIQNAEAAYIVLRRVIESRLEQKTDVSIKLSATVTNGQLDVSAEVTGIPEDVLPSCRLRLAVVEDEVETYLAMSTNGIRYRESVVREILDGAAGIAPKKGELKYSSSTPISDIPQHVADFISRFEAGRKLNFPDELKPPVKGPLSIIAWVQNSNPDANIPARMVLQSTMVPITGFGEPKPNAADKPAAAATPPATPAEPAAPATEKPQPNEGAPPTAPPQPE